MSLAGLLPLFDDEFSGWTEGAGISAGGETNAYAARRGVRPLYVASLWRRAQAPVLVLTPRPDDSRRLFDQLLTYLGESAPVHLLPEPEVLPFERLAVDARTVNQRLVSLCALTSWCEGDSDAPIVIASVAAALRYTLSPAVFEGAEDTVDSPSTVRLGQRFPVRNAC